MCKTNTSELLCSVPTWTYLESPVVAKVYFHHSHYGTLLWSFAVNPAKAQTIATLGTLSQPIPHELTAFIDRLWETTDMAGPSRKGLRTFRPTWLKMVINIAKAAVQFSAMTLPVETLRQWEFEPESANAWLTTQFRSRPGHIFSSAATEVAELPSLTRTALREALQKPKVSESARRWAVRNDAAAQKTLLLDRIEEHAANERNYADKSRWHEIGEEIQRELDEVHEAYKANGGRWDD